MKTKYARIKYPDIKGLKNHKDKRVRLLAIGVSALREKRGIDPDNLIERSLDEISCIAYKGGEIAQLVNRQLIHTRYPYGDWGSILQDGKVICDKLLDEVIAYLKKEKVI